MPTPRPYLYMRWGRAGTQVGRRAGLDDDRRTAKPSRCQRLGIHRQGRGAARGRRINASGPVWHVDHACSLRAIGGTRGHRGRIRKIMVISLRKRSESGAKLHGRLANRRGRLANLGGRRHRARYGGSAVLARVSPGPSLSCPDRNSSYYHLASGGCAAYGPPAYDPWRLRCRPGTFLPFLDFSS